MSHCSIAFDDFNLQTKEAIGSLLASGNFADVTIVCNDGDQVPAHKFVLSSSSSLLQQMLTNSSSRFQSRNDFIYLPTVKLKELKPLLQFMYLGQTKISQENLETFISLAADLKINLGSPKSQMKAQQKEDQDHNELVNEYDTAINNKISQNMECLNTATEIEETPDIFIGNDSSSSVEPLEENNLEEVEADEENEEVIGKPEETFLSIQYEDNKVVKKKTEKKLKGRKSNYPDDVIHKNIRYYCDFCDYQATQPNSLTLHIKQIHTRDVHTCKECNFETNIKQRLKEHTMERHFAKSNFPCTLCNFMGISAGDLKKHIEEKHDATKFPCDKCSYKASTPGHLAYHIKKLHCPYCDMVLFNKKRDSHIKMHEQENYGGPRMLSKMV